MDKRLSTKKSSENHETEPSAKTPTKKGDVLWECAGDRLDNVRAVPITVWDVLPGTGQYIARCQSGTFSMRRVGSPGVFSTEYEALLDWGKAALHSVQLDVENSEARVLAAQSLLKKDRALLGEVEYWLYCLQKGGGFFGIRTTKEARCFWS